MSAWRLATYRELADDLATQLRELQYGGAPALKDVVVFPGTSWDRLKATVENLMALPGAVIAIAGGDIPPAGARTKQTTRIHVFLASEYSGDQSGGTLGVLDLVGVLIRHFQPAAAAKNTQIVVNQVIWEPAGFETVDFGTGPDVARVRLEAIDFMRADRSEV